MDSFSAAFLLYIVCFGTALAEQGLRDSPGFTVKGAQYLPYDLDRGYQVLFPGMRFNCYGNITSWSALVVGLDKLHTSSLQLILQVWRPTGIGTYKLAGFDEILVDNIDSIANATDDTLAYYRLSNKTEDRDDDSRDKEENKPLYFMPGDILGFSTNKLSTGHRQMYITYQNQTESNSESLSTDLLFTRTDRKIPWCDINICSNETQKIASIIPNIFYTYDELKANDVVFQNQRPELSEDCDVVQVPVDECPLTSSTSVSPTGATTETVPQATPTISVNSSPQTNGMLLTIVAVSAAGAVVILILGGVFIVIVGLVCKKKKSLDEECNNPPREAANALYSEMNGVDEPTAYMETHRVKSGIYLERNASDPTAPHFSIRTGGSIISLSSHNGRPQFSISDSAHSGAASIQRILTPGDPRAMSMQLPRGARSGLNSGEDQRRSLRGVSNGAHHHRPPIPSAMQSHNQDTSRSCRGSMPLKTARNTQRQLHPGKSMPALSSPSQSPSPFPCPPTPQRSDQPLPYILPVKSWYKSDYEATTIPEKEGIVLPQEEGLYVPTMDERNGAGEDYSRLRQPHHSKGSTVETAFFDGPDVFNEPASSTNEIYQQLSRWNTTEIIRKYITLQGQIGSGHFATVCSGVWQQPGGEEEVAVKEFKSGAGEEDRVKFLQEAAIMSQFNHTNVVKLHGIVTIDEPLLIVMELMLNGDLKHYLDRFSPRRSPRQRHSTSSTPPPSPDSLLPITPSLPHQLLSFCRQVADGMNYLSQRRFVHRDLAARNIFLTKDFTCKIGDFGLARSLGGESLYRSRGGEIPVKWTAPEALQYRRFTSASDVWSYGMVIFEIWSLGHRPFDACNIEKDVMEFIGGSVCQPPPPGCPRGIYNLMTLCWNSNPSNRWSFSYICEYLNQSDSNLLSLHTELSSSLSPQATQLGAPLAEGKGLYHDLQYRYAESIV